MTFSEPMQREEVEKALNVFPATTGGLILAWHGSSLTISPDTAWEADRTYILTLQAAARDLHNNRLPRSLQIAFSTGVSIDSGVVTGRIFRAERPASGATALLFRVESNQVDPELDTADYVVTTDSSGRFTFGYLGPGSYRVFGLDDRDKDWLWNVGVEAIAVPALDARLTPEEDTVWLPPLIMTPLDTAMPAVLNCAWASPDMLQLDLSLNLDSAWLNRQRLTLRNGDVTKAPVAVYMLDSTANRIYARFDTAPRQGHWTVEMELEHPGTGRKRVDSCELEVQAEATGTSPTSPPLIDPDSATAAVAFRPGVYLHFFEPIDRIADATIVCRGPDLQVPVGCLLVTPFTVAVDLAAAASGQGPLVIEFPAGFLQWANGGTWPPADSSWIVGLPFPYADSTGQFEVSIDSTILAGWPGARLGLRSTEPQSRDYWLSSAAQGRFTGALSDGNYRLFVFWDRDSNLHRDAGWPHPYRPSEAVWELPDTLRVRARFTTELTLPTLPK